MAFIKCNGCGHMISDKAVKCPKCGMPVQTTIENAKHAEEGIKRDSPNGDGQKIETIAPIVNNKDKNTKSKKSIIAIVLGLVFVVVIIGAYFIWNSREPELEYWITGVYSEELVKCAERGDANAQYDLGVCYAEGNGVTKNESEAFKWFKLSAEQGDARGQRNLGRCYLTGVGIDKNESEAFKWLSLSGEQGDAKAMMYLWYCYSNGAGVSPDYHEALKWLKLAADKGYSDAMYYLGTHYMDGDGVSQSTDEAIRLWKAAAEQGNENAKKALAELETSETEDPVSRDLYNAYTNAMKDFLAEFYDDAECYYFFYDITHDGLPELWMKIGTCEADYTLRVCSYDKEQLYRIIWEKPAGHSGFYEGDNYILQWWAHQGCAQWDKLTYNGERIIATTVFEEDTNGTDRCYKVPTEKEIEITLWDGKF